MPLQWRGAVLVREIAEMVARVIATAVAGLAQMGALVIAAIGGRFGDRPEREDRGPRLGDTAFRAQRDADGARAANAEELAAQAHGEALTHLLTAWEKRDATQLPSAQDLGGRVSGVRSAAAWAQALSAAPKGDAAEALLRLEIAGRGANARRAPIRCPPHAATAIAARPQ